MKKTFLLATIIITSCLMFVNAQKHEIGMSLGKANIIGDIGKSNYIEIIPMDMDRLPISIGALYRFNLNNRQSLRFNLIYNKVYFDDFEASEDYRYKRGLSGDNTIIEASTLFEYYFFDINDIKRTGSSPYIFGGIGAYAYEDRNYKITHEFHKDTKGNPIIPSLTYPQNFSTEVSYDKSFKFDFSIPFGVGYKFKFKYNWLISFEVGARYTFQDNLDYSAIETNKFQTNVKDNLLLQSPYVEIADKRTADIIGQHQTGNTYKSNDWYLVWGFNLTYTFGRPPCYCY